MPTNLDALAVAHGVLTSMAIIFVFPLGAILLRIMPKRPHYPKPVNSHRRLQWAGYCLYIGGTIIGVVATGSIAAVNSSFANNSHIVLGGIVSILILLQPVWGEVHHRIYKRRNAASRLIFVEAQAIGAATIEPREVGGMVLKNPGRTLLAQLHLWAGRLIIIAGMINGGLGLLITNAAPFRNRTHQLVGIVCYTLVTAVMGLFYLGVAVRTWLKQRRLAHNRPAERTEEDGPPATGILPTAEEEDREREFREAQGPNAPIQNVSIELVEIQGRKGSEVPQQG